MTAAKVVATFSIVIGIAGVVLLARASDFLIKEAPQTVDGIIRAEDLQRVRRPVLIGWACIIVGGLAQLAAVWLA